MLLIEIVTNPPTVKYFMNADLWTKKMLTKELLNK